MKGTTVPSRGPGRRPGLLIALVALLSGCAPPTCGLGRVTAIPSVIRGDAMIVAGTVDGQLVLLVFDTGASFTVLTPSSVARLQLPAVALPRGLAVVGRGIGGVRPASLVKIRTLQLGRLQLADADLIEADVFASLGGTSLDGLLSTTGLTRFDFDVNTRRDSLELYRPLGVCRRPTVRMSGEVGVVPLARRQAGSGELLLGVSIAGHDMRALLDTGSKRTVLFRGGAARLGLAPGTGPGPSDRPLDTIVGIGPARVAAAEARLLPMRIGGYEVDNLPVILADQDSPGDFDMLLGFDVLRLFHVWISYSSGTLVLQPFDPVLDPVRRDSVSHS